MIGTIFFMHPCSQKLVGNYDKICCKYSFENSKMVKFQTSKCDSYPNPELKLPSTSLDNFMDQEFRSDEADQSLSFPEEYVNEDVEHLVINEYFNYSENEVVSKLCESSEHKVNSSDVEMIGSTSISNGEFASKLTSFRMQKQYP